MADVLLFHHALGRTRGVLSFAERLAEAGHRIEVPDLYEGQVFDDLDTGLAYVRDIGFHAVVARGRRAAERLPEELAYVGISLGVMPAQQLAQNRPGATAAVLISSAVPAREFGGPWPGGVPLQVHGMQADPIFVDEGDLAAARELISSAEHGELFLYPGDAHFFVDDSLPDYDERATGLVLQRIASLLSETPS